MNKKGLSRIASVFIIVLLVLGIISLLLIIKNIEVKPEFNITINTVEVNEIERWSDPTNNIAPVNCSTLNVGAESILNRDGYFCKDGIVQRLNLITKEDLTIEWLDSECECIQISFPTSHQGKQEGILNPNYMKYKCPNDYFVEVIK